MAILDSLKAETLPGGGSQSDAPAVVSAEGAAVTLPADFDATGADYARSGQDLVLTETDGDQVVIRDFFAGDSRPDLMYGDGARIDGDLAARLAGPAAPGQYAQASGSSLGEPIGQVETLNGSVAAVRTDGTRVTLQAGDSVYQGDLLESGPDSGIGIVLADETTFAMAENGRMVLDEMVYDPSAASGSVGVSILQGVFTFVSGQVAKTSVGAMTIETPVATICIRGTQGGIEYDGVLRAVLMQESEDAGGFVGEMILSNNAGISVLNILHQGVEVAGINLPHSPQFQMAVQQILSTFGDAFRVLPVSSDEANAYGVEQIGFDPAAGLEEFDTAAGGPVVGVPDTGVIEVVDDVIIEPDDLLVATVDMTTPTTAPAPAPVPVPVEDEIVPVVAPPEPTTGNEGDDVIFGTPGDDVLDGGAGNDTLIGGAGDDQVFGGPGNDTLVAGEGEGDDTYDGGADSDTITFTSQTDGVDVDLEDGTASGGDIDDDTIVGVENVIGGDGGDEIIGNDADNLLDGGDGNDELLGGGGDDELLGGDGDDVLIGDPEDDGGGLLILNENEDPSQVLRIDATGNASVRISADDIRAATGEGETDLEGRGIVVDDNGDIYFSENVSGSVLKKSALGGPLEVVATNAAIATITGGAEPEPRHLAFGSDGKLYITDEETNAIISLDPAAGNGLSVLVTEADFAALPDVAPGREISLIGGLVGNGDGRLFVASDAGGSGDLFAVDIATGTPSLLASDPAWTDLKSFITLAPNGDVIVADEGGGSVDDAIYRVGPVTGDVEIFLSNADLEAANGEESVDLEGGIGFDANGDFYVAEEADDNVLRFTGYDADTGTIDAASGYIAVTRDEISADTGGLNIDLEGGIAFVSPRVPGNDTLRGGAGDDTLFGGVGDDLLEGGDDEDDLFGGDGDDTLDGGEDADELTGGAGSDTLFGGTGNDILIGDGGEAPGLFAVSNEPLEQSILQIGLDGSASLAVSQAEIAGAIGGVSYSNDFSVGLAGGTLINANTSQVGVIGGELILSAEGFGGVNNWLKVGGGGFSGDFEASFDLLIDDLGSNGRADGFSFQVGSDVDTGGQAEEPQTSGLALTFDTFFNGGSDVINEIGLWFDGVKFDSSVGVLHTDDFVPVEVEMQGTSVTVKYDGGVLFDAVDVGGTVSDNSDFFFGARTGGFSDKHAIDNVSISAGGNVDLNESGIAVDAAGNLFFTTDATDDSPNEGVLVKRADTGQVEAVALANAGLPDGADPEDLVIGPEGTLYVLDDECNCIFSIENPLGTPVVTELVAAADFEALAGISTVFFDKSLAISPDGGTLFVSSNDTPSALFAVDTATGTPSVLSVDGGFVDLDGFITIAPNGDVIVVDDESDTGGTIYRIDPTDGTTTVFLSEAEVEAAAGTDVDLEGGVDFDVDGNFYVAETNTDSVYKWDVLDRSAGTIDSSSGALFASAAGIATAIGLGGVDLTGDLTFSAPGQADILVGGDGADTLTGGGGGDTFVFEDTLDFGDTITDFTIVEDVLSFDTSATVPLTHGAADTFQQLSAGFSLSADTAFVAFDTTGAPPDLDDTAALADDINLLNGLNAGDQVVFAFADGADARLIYWDDTALSADGLAEAGELSTIADLTGIGTVVGFTAANFATSAGPVEQGPSLDGLVFTDAVDTFDGPPQITNGDDVLVAVGNAEGGDSVDGLDGDDTLTLASGGDNTLSVANVEQIVGGGSEDDITFTTATGGTASVDGGGGSDSVRLADTANTIALSSVEGLDLFENDLLQDITLDGANDITIGSAGGGGSINLNVTGDAEFQAVRFGLNIASNTVVRDVNEITFEDGADHTLTVEDVDTISGGDGEQLVIVGAGDSGLGTSFFGGDGNDTFNGGTGDDTIDGGDGQDFLTGGAGADDIDGGSGAADAAVYTDSAAGVTIDLSASVVIGEGGDAEGDILTGIERLFGSQQNDILTADDSGNFLFGQGGGDTLTGGNGIDAIFGDAGVDILDGGAGNDDLEGGDGADDLTGGLGSDTANYNSLTAVTGVTVDLSLGIGLGGEADGDTLAEIENVRGSIHDDTLIGDDFANTLIGLQGVDIIKGGGGNDLLFGGDDADTFSYASPSDFGTSGDTIFDFDAAEDSFLFDTTGTVPLNRGEFSDTFQTAVSGIQLDDDTVFVAFNEGVTLSTAGFTTAINSLINIGAGSQAIFAFSDGVDGSLQYWDDLGGNIDGIADAGELSTIASINDLVDADLLTAANFATSAGQAVQGPEIVTLTFTPGVDTFGSDDGITTGDDVLIAVGAGSGNDSVDGLGGNDSLFLDNAVNALALTGVETVTGTIGNDTLTLTQGVGDGTLFDLGDGGSDDIILLGTVNNLGVANVEGITGTDGNDALTITETDAGAASIDLKAGVDDLVLLSAVNTFKALTGVETVTGTAGNDDLTFLGSVTGGAFDLSDGDDDVTALGSVTGGVFDLGGGTDSVTLGNPVNTFGVTDVEAVTGTSGNDTLTLSQSVGDGALFDLGDGGGDNIILLSTVNILGVANVEGITGTAGNDALTITETGAGAASIDLGVGNDGLVLLSAVNTFNGLTGAETVTGTAGNDDLTFLGSVTGGAFDLSDGDDDVTALGSVTGGVFDLGGGTDSVTLGAASNSIGVAGVETVTGTTGNDALTLTQGVPDGTLFDLGDGGGDNIFLLGTVNSLGVANVEGITGTAGNDALTITETGAGAASIDLGVGNDGLVLLSAVNTFNGLTGVETVTGTAGNDDLTVTGAISAGSLFDLGDGTDILNLGLAANTIAVANLETVQGTTGNDTLTLSQGVGDGTLFDLGGGISDDIILVSTVNSLGVANVEGITGTAGNDALTITETGAGAASIDLSVGNDGLVLLSAVNTFNGLTGVETVTGTAGNDDLTVTGAISVGSLFDLGDGTDILNLGLAANTIAVVNVETVQGTTGNDTLTFTTAVTGGTTVDLLAGTDTLNLANGDNVLSVSGVETVNGNAGDDTITVTDDTGTNIDGGDGFNRLTGGGGDDTLTGGDDRDFLTGGAGADDLDGGAGTIDTAFYSGSSVGVTIDLSTPTGTGVGGDAEGDTLTGIEFIVGSSQGDTMIGGGGNDIFVSEGGDDILSGGGGDDFFRGGAGADDLTGGLGTDQAEYLSSGVGVTVDLSLGTGLGGEAEGDTLSEIENLTGSSFNDTLIGEVGANTLNGSGGDDVIRGGGGNDLLSGFTGADTFAYASPTDFGTSGDTISDFDATEDGFLFDTTGTVPLNRGNADTFQLAFGGVPLDDDTVFVAFDETVTLSTAGFTAAINSLIDVGAGSQAIFAFSDGANGSLQYWDDLNGDNDGIADAGELSTIASLTGFTDAGLLSAANFATSAGQAVQGPELISLNFTSGVDTFGAADGITTGDDVLIAVGAASGSDSVDGLGGNDTLVLGDLGNTLAVANIENLIGGAGADDITVTGAVVDFDALTANLDFADTVFTGQDFTLSGDTINSGLSTSGTVTLKGANTFNGVVTNELGADMVLQRQFSDPLNVDAAFEAGLANAGTIQFNTQSDPSNKTTTLTIGAGESLTNSGTVETISNTSGTDSIVGDVINSGTLSANGDDLFITGDVTNSGVLNAGASRTLRVDTGTLTANADTSVTGTGTLALANGADLIVNLDLATAVGITMGSGSVVSSGGGNSLTTSGASSLSSGNMNVAFVAAGAVTATGMAFADTVNNQSTMTLKGTNTFDGLVTNEGGATMVLQRQFSDPLNVDATFEAGLANAGTIQFNTQSDPSNKTATLTMGAGETLDNSGTIETISSTSGTDSIVGDVLNSGTLSANGDDLIVTGDATNTGTLDMAASQSLTMDGGTLTANGGTIISGSGTLSLTNGADLTMNLDLDLTLPGLSMGSGSVISSVGGNDLTTTGTSSLSSADINVGYTTSGTANVAGMTFADTVNNQGTMTLKGTNTFDGLVTNEGAATMVLQRTFSDPLNVDATFDGGLTNVGTIQFNTQSDPQGKTATLTMGAGETLDNSGTIETISNTSGTDGIVGDVLTRVPCRPTATICSSPAT